MAKDDKLTTDTLRETFPEKKRPFFWALPKFGVGGSPAQIDVENGKTLFKLARSPLPQLILTLSPRVKKMRKLRAGGWYFGQCPKSCVFFGKTSLFRTNNQYSPVKIINTAGALCLTQYGTEW